VRLSVMRKGISITVTAEDRVRLDTIIRNRNSAQKHVWRARIIVLTADGAGTTAITRAVGKGKTVVWRWQERFMHEGIEGLTRDKTRPSRIPPLPAETVDRVVALTNQAPPHEATHWSAPAMAKTVGISPSSVRRIWFHTALRTEGFERRDRQVSADSGQSLSRKARPVCRGEMPRAGCLDDCSRLFGPHPVSVDPPASPAQRYPPSQYGQK
jgi:transposase